MAPNLNIIFSDHAKARALQRGIDPSEIEEAVQFSDNRKQGVRGPHKGFQYECRKEIGERTLIVIAEIFKSDCWIITGYWKAEAKDE